MNNLLATVTEKVLEKPVVNIANFHLTLTDLVSVGIIFGVAYAVYWCFRFFMAWQVKRDRIRKSQSKTLIQLAGYIITISAMTFAFSSVGYSLTYLLVGSTALLVGLGFGLQQMFMDLISGVILLIDKNINYGDVVKLDFSGSLGQVSGKIINIGLRTTQLETIDNEIIIVPNSKILQTGMKSLMRSNGSVRFRIQIQVAFNTNMNKAKELMSRAVLEHIKTDKDPLPTVIVKHFAESGVDLEIRLWMKELFLSENILSDIRYRILELFVENNIEIPYPHRVLLNK